MFHAGAHTKNDTMQASIDHIVGQAQRRRTRFFTILGCVFVFTLCCATLGMSYGAVAIPAEHVWEVIFAHLNQRNAIVPQSSDNIIWLIRAPRVSVAGLIGSILALIGVVTQALVRNPLADPYVLGIESGAAAGAVAVITLVGSIHSSVLTPTLGGLFGALATVALVFGLSYQHGAIVPLRLLLIGVACSYALSGFTTFMQYSTHDPAGQAAILFWLIGGLGGADWAMVPPLLLTLLVSTLILFRSARALNLLAMGDATALSVGIQPDRVRVLLFVLTALAVAVAVTAVGPIGFVGLVVPHIGRLIVGADHRRLIPFVLIAGAAYLIAVDLLARVIFAPSEVPVGVLTAVIGAPVLIWLIRRRDRTLGGGRI